MTVVMRDGVQIEVPHRRLDIAMRLIAECAAKHGLATVTTSDDSTTRVQHRQSGPTFTMASASYETKEGIQAVEEWLRGVHGEDVLAVPPTEVEAP